VRVWIHANMLTVNGQKMSKSLNNSILPFELFTGNHALLEQAYSPMTIRFFALQTHYSSTLDITNDALKAAEKGYKRLMNSLGALDALEFKEDRLKFKAEEDKEINALCDACAEKMNDDFNTPETL